MVALNSSFDIVSRDPHPNALASLMVILDVLNPPAVSTPGTPTPGTIVPGNIVEMDPTTGKLVLGDSTGCALDTPRLMMVAVDGDQDYDGAFLHRVTCLAGGLQMKTDQFVTASYTYGQPLTVGTSGGSDAGKLKGLTTDDEPLIGYVGPDGLANGVLDVIMPQTGTR